MSEIKQMLEGKELTEAENVKFVVVFDNELSSDFSVDIMNDSGDGWGLGMDMTSFARYYKGVYSNLERLRSRFLVPKIDNGFMRNKRVPEKYKEIFRNFITRFEAEFERVQPFSYSETFELKNETFQSIVWGSIDIGEMVEALGGVRIAVEGIPVRHKKFSKNGDFIGYEEYDSIYEIYEADGNKLNSRLTNKIYAVKCWCTSTNKEHFIWIDEKYKNDPLSAIASTFMVHKNLIPYIKEIKRQGDLLLVEYTEEAIKLGIKPEGEMVSLTKEQYFGLLTAQS